MPRLVRASIRFASFAFLLVYASDASASTISMVWIAASGGVGVGTPTLSSITTIGDTAVLEIRVNVQSMSGTAGIEAIGVAFEYDGHIIQGTDIQPCPATVNNQFGPGNCGAFATAIGGAGGFLGVLSSPLNQFQPDSGLLASGAVVRTIPGNGQANGAFFELAHITFTVVNAGPITGGVLFRGVDITGDVFRVDGQVDIGGAFSPTVPATGAILDTGPIPEPGTLALLALGLGALAACGRRTGRGRHSAE